jgi:hypothetical protein
MNLAKLSGFDKVHRQAIKYWLFGNPGGKSSHFSRQISENPTIFKPKKGV